MAKAAPDSRLHATSTARMTTGGSGQTVYDPLLGITWLADANLASKKTFGVQGINRDGSMDYQTAVNWVRAMNAYDHGKGYLDHNDWMLPTTPSNDPGCLSRNKNTFGYSCSKSALGSLYYETLGLHEPDTAVPISSGEAGPFSNFQPYLYWTETIAAKHQQGYRTFSFNTGWAGSNVSKHNMYALPMIEGNPFDTPAGNGKGLHPSANGKTVYDPAAGVTWLADANLAKTKGFGIHGINRDGSMQQLTAVDWITAMNKAAWLGETHWQLPAAGKCGGFDCKDDPLGELYYQGLALSQGESVVAASHTNTRGYQDIQPYLYWSCAGESVQDLCKGAPAPGFAWSFSFGNGFEGTDLTQNNLYVMVYYPTPSTPPTPSPVRPPSPCPPQKPGHPTTCK